MKHRIVWKDANTDVDFTARTVSYYGCNGEEYTKKCPAVEVE